MIETEDGSRGAHQEIAEQIRASLAEHGTVLPAVVNARARMEWPCVRLLTDKRFGILFVECIELSVRKHQQQVTMREAKERALAEVERRRQARELVPNYLSACINECAEQTRKVKKAS